MDDGLPPQAFRERMTEIIASTDHDWILEARGNTGPRPVGLVLAANMGRGRAIEPHVDWFPWATGRNKVEASAVFLRDVSRNWKVFVFADAENAAFWHRMVRYRILRRGCKVPDYYARGDDAWMFYTMGP